MLIFLFLIIDNNCASFLKIFINYHPFFIFMQFEFLPISSLKNTYLQDFALLSTPLTPPFFKAMQGGNISKAFPKVIWQNKWG